MSDVQLFSRKVRFLFQTLFLLSPVFTAFYWLHIEEALALEINPFHMAAGKWSINATSKWMGFVISLLPTFVVMALFSRLAFLFKNYQNKNVFSQENVNCFGQLGKLLYWLAGVNFITTGLLSLVLSFQNAPGERFLTLSFGSPQVLPIMIGLVIHGIAYVMKEATQLQDEMRFTI